MIKKGHNLTIMTDTKKEPRPSEIPLIIEPENTPALAQLKNDISPFSLIF